MISGYVEPRRPLRSLTKKEKTKDFNRICALCGKPLSVTDKGDTVNLKGRIVVVHKKCKYEFYEKKLPKE